MTKIALTTKYSSYNFGAMLQTYALQTTIQKLGAECIVVDADRKKAPGLLSGYGPGCLVHNVFYKLHQNDLKTGYSRFDSFLQEMNKSQLYSGYDELKQQPPQADIYLAGSDQVWNPLDIQENYFLRYAPKDTIRASYAASMGISYMPEGCKRIFTEYLADIDYLSVREKTAQQIIKNQTGRDAFVHLDPTLLLTPQEWKEVAVQSDYKKPYIFCYILYRPKWLNGWLKQLHKVTGKEIVVISSEAYRNIYHTRMVRDAGPKEMLGWIQNADFVISSSFHGVALSIANQKPFYAVVNPEAPARITDLLNIFDLKDRIIDSQFDVKLSEMNYEKVEQCLAEQRNYSFAYLEELMQHPQKRKREALNNKPRYQGNISMVGDQCTGCKVCLDVCPVDAINFCEDAEGFCYPVIQEDKCVSCGKCLKYCHTIDQKKNTKESCSAYYGWNHDAAVRNQSTSGGIFSAMAAWIQSQNGVVIGAYYDSRQKKVLHGCSDNVDIERFRKSKYVESDMADSIQLIQTALSKGKKVLFTGTPCQCAAIRKRFGTDKNLLLSDFFCHGVPSGKVFRDFLEYKEKKAGSELIDYQFRTKDFGWSQYGISVVYKNGKTEKTVGRCEFFYTASMLDDLFLRKSCYTCDKSMYHYADITIGDFWGIASLAPKMNDNKGISAFVVNTEAGKMLLDAIAEQMEIFPLETHYLDYAFKVKTSDKKLVKRNTMFDEYNQIGIQAFINKHYKKRLYLSKTVFQLKKRKFRMER